MATHSNSLTWRIPWRESLEGYSPWGLKELDMTMQIRAAWHFLLLQGKVHFDSMLDLSLLL